MPLRLGMFQRRCLPHAEGSLLIGSRTLHLVHEQILSVSAMSMDSAVAASFHPETSVAGLDSAIKMMGAVASDHLRKVTNIDRLPVCAGYNFTLCINHLRSHQGSVSHGRRDCLKDLEAMVDVFRQRWPIDRSCLIT